MHAKSMIWNACLLFYNWRVLIREENKHSPLPKQRAQWWTQRRQLSRLLTQLVVFDFAKPEADVPWRLIPTLYVWLRTMDQFKECDQIRTMLEGWFCWTTVWLEAFPLCAVYIATVNWFYFFLPIRTALGCRGHAKAWNGRWMPSWIRLPIGWALALSSFMDGLSSNLF